MPSQYSSLPKISFSNGLLAPSLKTDLLFEILPLGRKSPSGFAVPFLHLQPSGRSPSHQGRTPSWHLGSPFKPVAGSTQDNWPHGPRAQTSMSEVWLAQEAKPSPVPRTTGTVLVADEPGVSNIMFSPSVNIKKKFKKLLKYYTQCVVEALHREKAAFSGSSSEHTDILILIQHLTPTSPHQEAKHSIRLCHPLWPGDDLPGYKAASAKSHFLITAQFLPNLDLPSAAFQAGRNACLLTIKATPLGSSVSDSRF